MAFLSPTFVGSSRFYKNKASDKWERRYYSNDRNERVSNVIRLGIDQNVKAENSTTGNPVPHQQRFAEDLTAFVESKFHYQQKTDYSYKVSETEMASQQETQNNISKERESFREPSEALTLVLQEMEMDNKGKIILLGSQRPLNVMLCSNTKLGNQLYGYSLNLRKIKSDLGPNVFDFYYYIKEDHSSKPVAKQTEWKRNTALGSLFESEVLDSGMAMEDRNKSSLHNIFYLDLTPKVRFIYHTEIDHGTECEAHSLEFKTVFPADLTQDPFNIQRIFRLKLKTAYCKAMLSRLDTVVLAAINEEVVNDSFAEDGAEVPRRPDYICKDIAFFNAAKIPALGRRLKRAWNENSLRMTYNMFSKCLNGDSFLHKVDSMRIDEVMKIEAIQGKKPSLTIPKDQEIKISKLHEHEQEEDDDDHEPLAKRLRS